MGGRAAWATTTRDNGCVISGRDAGIGRGVCVRARVRGESSDKRSTRQVWVRRERKRCDDERRRKSTLKKQTNKQPDNISIGIFVWLSAAYV